MKMGRGAARSSPVLASALALALTVAVITVSDGSGVSRGAARRHRHAGRRASSANSAAALVFDDSETARRHAELGALPRQRRGRGRLQPATARGSPTLRVTRRRRPSRVDGLVTGEHDGLLRGDRVPIVHEGAQVGSVVRPRQPRRARGHRRAASWAWRWWRSSPRWPSPWRCRRACNDRSSGRSARLSEAMAAVAVDRDYAIRVDGTERADEIGQLSTGFNKMLGEIAVRDEAAGDAPRHARTAGGRRARTSCASRRNAPRTPAAPRASSSPT